MRALHLLALGLLAWTHVGWGVAVRLLRRAGRGRVTDDREARAAGTVPPDLRVSVVIAAYAEEDAIA